jgi:hypothetical protein
MRSSTHGRLAGLIALAACGTGVAFAVTGSVDVVSPRTVEANSEIYPPLDPKDAPTSPAQGVLGARETRAMRERNGDDRRKRRGDRAEEADEAAVLAAFIPEASGGGGAPLPCSDTNSCVNRVGRLVTDVADRVPNLPRLRECTSSIGGAAICFDFGGGNYLVGDGPADGETELGFCTSSGYYYVSAPSAAGEAGAKCPDAPPAP